MPRPRKNTIEYFPHFVSWGKTLTILDERYGNDGYGAWFKLLEILGSAPGHSLDLSDEVEWEYLVSCMRVSSETAHHILDLLARLGAIDKDLWAERIVWSENFVHNLESVYNKRREELPKRPQSRVSGAETPQDGANPERKPDKVKHSKAEQSTEETNTPPAGGASGREHAASFEEFWSAYPMKRGKADAERWWKQRKPDRDLLSRMLQAIADQQREKETRIRLGLFAAQWPHGSTWLQKRRWEDESKTDDELNLEAQHECRNGAPPAAGNVGKRNAVPNAREFVDLGQRVAATLGLRGSAGGSGDTAG